jgi:hypothetical protein
VCEEEIELLTVHEEKTELLSVCAEEELLTVHDEDTELFTVCAGETEFLTVY